MNPYRKGAAMLLRLVALGLASVGGLNTWLEFLRERAGKGPPRFGYVILFGALTLAGLILLVGSGALAKRLTEDFDE
jgi:hypothetical protein